MDSTITLSAGSADGSNSPEKLPITVTWTRDGQSCTRSYVLTFLKDEPLRAEAVQFFTTNARLISPVCIPPEVETMPLERAQAYLDLHPTHRQWETLTIQQQNWIFDHDLERLKHLPEIKRVHITSSRITNAGVRHLRNLSNLEHLIVYSRRVTSACLSCIDQHRNLRSIDFQMAPFVSRAALFRAAAKLPNVTEIYPPMRWPVTAVIRWFYAEWRVQRKQCGTSCCAGRSA